MNRPQRDRLLPLNVKSTRYLSYIIALWISTLFAQNEPFINPTFNALKDNSGFRWDINSFGGFSDGTNDSFDAGLVLYVNGQKFQSNQSKMRSDYSEYVLNHSIENILITRRVFIDKENSVARYLEIFENPTNKELDVQVVIQSKLGAQCLSRTTIKGKEDQSLGIISVGKVDRATHRRPNLFFYMSGEKSKVSLKLPDEKEKRTFGFEFTLKIPPKTTKTIYHIVAQRHSISSQQQKEMVKFFSPFNRKFEARIPNAYKHTIVNFIRSFSNEAIQWNELIEMDSEEYYRWISMRHIHLDHAHLREYAFLQHLEELSLDRESLTDQSYLIHDPGTHFMGDIETQNIKIKTSFGNEIEISTRDLMGIENRTPASTHLWLNTGEIIKAQLIEGNLLFRGNENEIIELKANQMKAILWGKKLKAFFSKNLQKNSSDTQGILTLIDGSKVYHRASPSSTDLLLQFNTSWGIFKRPLQDLVAVFRKLSFPPTRVLFKDGTRLDGIWAPGTLQLEHPLLGEISIPFHQIHSWVRMNHSQSDERYGNFIFLLKDQSVLPWHIPDDKLKIITGNNPLDLFLSRVSFFEETDNGENRFTFNLADDKLLSGDLHQQHFISKHTDRPSRIMSNFILAGSTLIRHEPKSNKQESPSGQSSETKPLENLELQLP